MKNELGVSNTAGTKGLRGWGHNGMNRGTGGLKPLTPVNSNPERVLESISREEVQFEGVKEMYTFGCHQYRGDTWSSSKV